MFVKVKLNIKIVPIKRSSSYRSESRYKLSDRDLSHEEYKRPQRDPKN